MDWSIFHWLNDATRDSGAGQDAAKTFNNWAIVVIIVGAAALWVLARPGGSLRLKLATACAGLSAVLSLIANVVLGKIWYHDRPFVTHPSQTVLLIHHAPDNGFPSEHASVAFAIAFGVLVFHRWLGTAFLLFAAMIALDRIFVGVHYPADIVASFLVGLGAALVVGVLGRPYLTWLVRQVSRLTDPVVSTVRRPVARW
jgi:membrane-associated phospholipid phosphatase